jgi:hypothetical protein
MKMENIGLYAKAVAGSVAAGLTAAVTALTDGVVTGFEWTVIVGAFLVAFGAVWLVPNVPESVRKYGKMIVGGLVAVVASVGAALVDGTGVSQAELLTIALALLAGLGLVGVTPNAASSDAVDPLTNKVVPVSAEVKEAINAPGDTTVVVADGEVVVAPAVG